MNFMKNSIFSREQKAEPIKEDVLHGGVLAVWGSPGSGKSTVAVKIAKHLADKKKNVVLVLCDMTAPMLPCICPPSDLECEKSLGSILSATHVTEPLVKYNMITHKKMSYLTVIGMLKGENEYTYAAYSKVQAQELIESLRKITPFVIIDCSSYIFQGGNMEAERLRIGEERRDASTKIRGFLYQDLLTLKVLNESDNETKVYSEWVEDIYTENDADISIIQAKYYPASTVNFSSIFEDMYYQFLKVKLYKINKSVSLKCYYHGDTEFSNETCVADFVYGNVHKDLSDEEIQSISVKIKECSNMSERKNLIFSNLNKQQFMDEFNLDIIKTGTIDDLYIAVKEALFNEYKNVGLLSRIDNTQAKDILISIFVSFIQIKYY